MDNVTEMDYDAYAYKSVARQTQIANSMLIIFNSSLFGLGTVLNVWFIIAVLSSTHHRGRLRSQLICNLSISHLAVSLVKSPIMIFYAKLLLRDFQWDTLCDSLTQAVRLTLASDFIQDCLLFFIATAYLSSVTGLNPSKWLGSGATAAGKLIINLLPWLVSPALMPLLTRLLPENLTWCLSPLPHEIPLAILFISVVPNLAFFVVVSVAFAVHRCRFGSRSPICPTLPGQTSQRRRHVDNPLGYIVAALVSHACEAPFLVFIFTMAVDKYAVKMTFISAACGMADSKSVLMLLPWLLLPDIRDRLMGWRPWQRSSGGPGEDSQRDNLALETGE